MRELLRSIDLPLATMQGFSLPMASYPLFPQRLVVRNLVELNAGRKCDRIPEPLDGVRILRMPPRQAGSAAAAAKAAV